MTPGVHVQPYSSAASSVGSEEKEASLQVETRPALPEGIEAPGSPVDFFRRPQVLAGLAGLCCLLVLIYAKIVAKLVLDWYNIPDYSHGFLVPFFAGFLLWDKRNKLRTMRMQPAWGGLVLVALGVVTVIFWGCGGGSCFFPAFRLW